MHTNENHPTESSELDGEAWELIHNMPNALRTIVHFLDSASAHLPPEWPENGDEDFDTSIARPAFSAPVTALANSIDKLVADTAPTSADRRVSEGTLSELVARAEGLRRSLNAPLAIAIPEAAANGAADVQRILATCRTEGAKLRGELEKEVKRRAEVVHKLATYYHLQIALEQLEKLRHRSLNLLEWRYSLERPLSSPQSTRVSEIVKAAMKPSRQLARRRRIKIQPKIDGDPKVFAVEDDIVAALQQLLSNAIKYSDQLPPPDEAWIDVRSSEMRGEVSIAVESWGLPIAEDEIREGKIWLPGYRGRYVRRHVPDGAGLGLSRVKRTIESNQGRISVTSVPSSRWALTSTDQNGHYITTFEITLPAAKANLAAIP